MKKLVSIGALAAVSALTLAACSSAPEESGSSSTAAATDTPAASLDYTACMVSDSGGFDDKSFNQAGFEGLQQAKADLGIEVSTAESTSDADFAPNIAAMVDAGCDLTITVGFLLGDATAEAATSNPDSSFAIIDVTYEDSFDNLKSLTFETDEAAFLAGYAAAASSKTGVVGTFGGIQIPSVTIFMDGFLSGVEYYNEAKGTDVQVLGWDGENGSFTGDFSDQTKGQSTAQGFIDQGADIILPVAGPVGLGAAAAAQAAGDVWIIGVDSDWTLTTEYADIILTSIMKNMGPAVYDVVKTSAEDGFSSEAYVGTLENGGVGVSAFAANTVDEATDAEIQEISAGIIDGSIEP
ncbi:BMP family lipoprotein [Demequina lignilytica]|uniref:BMP family ABC transporter substrate-binding protein n=1 Tax=Demequina lignilytica TaxID=3051663 RepID=A0AB35MGW0_9MICO|nr:BMP family ABC transporter substrate-binding protein [Demequina sp. SYSU T0a273]MDN4482965.1 BMP family ABC transporter substrate-binding protein [Demequina sp. SYSU T0a273]